MWVQRRAIWVIFFSSSMLYTPPRLLSAMSCSRPSSINALT
uniref:Uncharacterized protein n=1 Tax=Arundo donax TaxID=35708 RepID=A0A0A9ELX0_ARUDO